MIAILFLTVPKDTYKDNDSIGTSAKCLHVDNDGCVSKTGLLEY